MAHYRVVLLELVVQDATWLLPNITLSSMAGCNTARSDTDNITHAILVPLIAVLHAGIGTFEAVIPGRDA